MTNCSSCEKDANKQNYKISLKRIFFLSENIFFSFKAAYNEKILLIQ